MIKVDVNLVVRGPADVAAFEELRKLTPADPVFVSARGDGMFALAATPIASELIMVVCGSEATMSELLRVVKLSRMATDVFNAMHEQLARIQEDMQASLDAGREGAGEQDLDATDIIFAAGVAAGYGSELLRDAAAATGATFEKSQTANAYAAGKTVGIRTMKVLNGADPKRYSTHSAREARDVSQAMLDAMSGKAAKA